MSKISIRFYKDHKVRAVWDEEHNHWWFSALDIVGAINQQDDHEKNRNDWKYLKAKLRKEQSEVVSDTTQLKLTCLAVFMTLLVKSERKQLQKEIPCSVWRLCHRLRYIPKVGNIIPPSCTQADYQTVNVRF